ncbi:MAG TPA: hypothetical protein DIW81_22190 [Planctomycetaceae bacterium]|nr:hypothetical protein [Planctomycetaceae bacterium]
MGIRKFDSSGKCKPCAGDGNNFNSLPVQDHSNCISKRLEVNSMASRITARKALNAWISQK